MGITAFSHSKMNWAAFSRCTALSLMPCPAYPMGSADKQSQWGVWFRFTTFQQNSFSNDGKFI